MIFISYMCNMRLLSTCPQRYSSTLINYSYYTKYFLKTVPNCLNLSYFEENTCIGVMQNIFSSPVHTIVRLQSVYTELIV